MAEPMLNLGPKSKVWLREIGIETLEDLQAMGAVEAYRRLKFIFPKQVSLTMLWALAGAVQGRHWNSFSAAEKAALKRDAGLQP